jgi:hypothetical protein
MRFRFAVLAAVAVLPLTLAACGGGDDTTGGGSGLSSDDQAQITKTIQFAAVSGDPKACTEAQTLKFTEQTTGETGQAAVKSCEKDAKDTPADSVEATNIDGDSGSATADAVFKGGFFDGQTIEVGLVKEGDKWKLDEAIGFKNFDRDAFLAGLKKEFASQGGASPAQVDCVSKNLDGLSDQQIEDLFLNSDKQLENQVFGSCFSG